MRPLVMIGAGGASGALLGVAAFAPDGARSAFIAGIIGAAIGAVLAATVMAHVLDSRPMKLRRSLSIPADRVHDHATWWFGRAPWRLARNEANYLVFRRQREPSIGVAVIYFLLGIIPGVLYLILGRSSQTITIGIYPGPDGTDVEIVVHPRADGGRRRAIRFVNSLHELQEPATDGRRGNIGRAQAFADA